MQIMETGISLVFLLFGWYRSTEFCAGIPREVATFDLVQNRHGNPNIPWGRLRRMWSANRDISNFIFKPTSYNYKLNVLFFAVVLWLSSFAKPALEPIRYLPLIRTCSLLWLTEFHTLSAHPNITRYFPYFTGNDSHFLLENTFYPFR